MTAITLEDLTLGYDGHPAVHHLSGSFAAGTMTAVIGPNGSGKSTLLKALTGVLQPMHGRILRPPGAVAFLPQQVSIDPSFPATAGDLVSMGLWHQRGWFNGFGQHDRQAIDAALAQVGLHGFAGRTVESLSGGQLQRVLFARLSLQQGDVILLDEPFTAIDAQTVDDMMVLLQRWHQAGKTVIAVLHDMALVRQHFPRTLLLAREKIGWGDTPHVVTPENMQAARSMREAWDDDAPWCDRSVA